MLKSKIVLSPAGSGKTERLARRYIELLENGVLPERILTITFTEKAAAEMKARIFQILKQENPELYKKIIEKSMLLRIKTIDSFCLSLLKRFAQLCGYEYDLDVLSDSSYLQKLSIVEAMSKIEKSGPELKDYQRLVYIIANQKFKGWGIIEELFGALYERRLTQERVQIAVTEGLNELFVIVEELKNHPITIQKIPEFENLILNPLEAQNIEKIIQNFEMIKHKFLQSSGKLRSAKKSPLENEWYKKIFDCYRIVNQLNNQKWLKEAVDLFTNCFLEEFSKLKKERNLVDFADLEILTYKILTENPNWANVLYFFDEHTDHILVDEFQDTSFLQWAIIRKLTEEWFAGLGIKQEQQIKPTIFLVGDDKQSIYMFRNAHPEIFNYARAYFESRLKGDFDYEEVTSNYRSLPAITHFTNQVFSQLMGADKQSDLSTIKYKAFESKRNNSNPGVVEIILISSKDQKDIRKKEAEILAKKILTIINTPIIYDKDEKPQSVRFEDIAVLLRSRTYLDKYEKAFRKYRIPFVIIKGMGFYSTPEVALLKELVSFLVDPNNDYSFYVILKSPLFGLTEKELLTISQYQSNGIVNSLWQRFQKYAQTQPSYQELVNKIIKWTSTVGLSSLVEIIQEILNSQNIWRIFWEEERIVNIKKFLNMVDELETKGLTPDFIVDYFEKNAQNKEEPKANVNTEGKNAVKIMTIHAAKGLQFPVVFLPALDRNFNVKEQRSRDTKLIMSEKDENKVIVAYEPESSFRKEMPLCTYINIQELEEEKRVFYVGVTRARDALYLVGVDNLGKKTRNSQLGWLKSTLGINYNNNKYYIDKKINIPGFSIITGQEVEEIFNVQKDMLPQIPPEKKEINTQELSVKEYYEWRIVTEELPEVSFELRQKHGEHWIVIGEILHRIFEALSRYIINFSCDEILKFARKELFLKYFSVDLRSQNIILDEIKRQIDTISTSEILEIILPKKTDRLKSFCELPFIFAKNNIIYSGRVDRVIIDYDHAYIYDYKTFPVTDTEIPILLTKYRKQIKLYEEAMKEIFSVDKTCGFLVFTFLGKIHEVM